MNASSWMNERKERMRILLGWLVLGIAGLLLNSVLTEWLLLLGTSPMLLQFFLERFALAIFWLVPLWVQYFLESRRVYGNPIFEWRSLERAIDRMEHERRTLVHMLHFKDTENEAHVMQLEKQIDILEKKRRIIESGLRHSAAEGLRGEATQRLEERLLVMRFAFTIACSLLVVTALSLFSI
jgi:hypothetical protein